MCVMNKKLLKKQNPKIYMVTNEGELKAVFLEKEEADEYVESQFDKAIEDAAKEYGYDLDSEFGFNKASYQAGYDGGNWEVTHVRYNKIKEDGDIECEDCTVPANEILDMLKKL